MIRCKCGNAVEQSLLPCELGDEHHADEEEVNVRTARHGLQRISPWHEAEADQRRSACHRPDGLRQPPRAHHDAHRRQKRDGPDFPGR